VPAEPTDFQHPGTADLRVGEVPPSMIESPPSPELLSSLGRLARGLSVLFWGLPAALVVCVQSAKGDWFRPLGIIPPLLATALLAYGLALLTHFQQQERVWRTALDRAKFVAFINVGTAPFLYWWSRIPSSVFFSVVVQTLMLSGVVFLILLNPVLVRLTAMLPDETLRLETRFFTTLNRYILFAILGVMAAYFVMIHVEAGLPDRFLGWLMKISPLPPRANAVVYFVDQAKLWIILFFVLLPLAMTMALLWKIKEIILASVFGPEN
jgi:hypothetical protein